MRAAALLIALACVPRPGHAQATATLAPADSTPVVVDTLPATPIVVDFGTDIGTSWASSVDASTSATGEGRRRGTTTQVRITRVPDSLSATFARLLASGERIPRVDATLPGSRGGTRLTLRLSDVQVVSARFLAAAGDQSLEQELLAARASVAQLEADRDEAERQLAAIGSLERRQLSAPLDVARARSTAEVAGVRLGTARARLALLQRRMARWSPVQEELVLSAPRAEVDAP